MVALTGAAGLGTALPAWTSAATSAGALNDRPDFSVRIVPASIEIAAGHTVRTTTYGGVVPGPTLRMREGVPVTIDVFNETDALDVIHWHGQIIPPSVDGVIELGTPPVPAHGYRRYRFTPRPRGTRWYHTHVGSGGRTDGGGFNGEFGFVIVEPRSDPARYDREVLLALHEFEGQLVTTHGMMGSSTEADYRLFSVNGRALGHGDPIRVRAGERVLLRILNASATLTHQIALPGHRFTIVALDGNPVPTPRTVDVVTLGVAERVDAIVEMRTPGVWVLGSTTDVWRTRGLGVVIEYMGQRGRPIWRDPAVVSPWNYASLGNRSTIPQPDHRFELEIAQSQSAPNRWMINGLSYPHTVPLTVERGKRYRIAFSNMSMMEHPMHLHGHVFELASIDGVPTAGVRKDSIVISSMMGQAEIDLVADNPGTFLLHCHNEIHMDGGLMTTLAYRT